MHPDLNYSDAWADQGVHIIKPRTDGAPESSTAAMSQFVTIAQNLPALCEETGCNLVVFDTVTAAGTSVFRESVDSGKHATGNSPKFNITIGKDTLRMNTADRRDYGLVQKFLRDYVRDVPVKHPDRNYHLLHVAHMAESRIPIGKDAKGEAIFQTKGYGPSVGGPAAVEMWGTDFTFVHRVYMDNKGQRHLQIQTMEEGSVPIWCRTNSGGKTPTTIPVPEEFEKAKDAWTYLLKLMGIFLDDPRKGGYMSGTLIGAPMSGKTRWMSTLAGLDGITGILYIAIDGNSEYLGSWWNEVKGLA